MPKKSKSKPFGCSYAVDNHHDVFSDHRLKIQPERRTDRQTDRRTDGRTERLTPDDDHPPVLSPLVDGVYSAVGGAVPRAEQVQPLRWGERLPWRLQPPELLTLWTVMQWGVDTTMPLDKINRHSTDGR